MSEATKTPYDAARVKAETVAERDFKNNSGCHPEKYGAMRGSAWEAWYIASYLKHASDLLKKYKEEEGNEQPKTI